MSRTKDKYSRRLFLQAGGLGLGLLPLLSDELAAAACGGAAGKKRLITLTWGNGLQQWVSGTGANFTLPDIMKALEPHRADLLIPDTIFCKTFDDQYPQDAFDNKAHDSPVAQLLGRPLVFNPNDPNARIAKAPSASPSLDYFIADALRKTNPTPYPVVNLAVMGKSNYWTWQAPSVVATPDSDPYHAFDSIFGGAAMGTDMPSIDKTRLMRKSVLDYVGKDLARFARTLGTADKVRIEAHLASVRAIEQRLVSGPASGDCQVPTLAAKFDVQSSDNFEKTLRAQMDIGVAALAAGVTQVLTIQASNGSGTHVNLTWLGYQTGTNYGHDGCCADASSHHASAHDNGKAKTDIDTWFFAQVAYLLDKLKAQTEGNGSLFDSSVLLVPNNMDHGNNHKVRDQPWLMAGSAGGVFKTGRVLQTNNASHTQLLTGICNAFGVSPEGFVDPAYGGELPGLRG